MRFASEFRLSRAGWTTRAALVALALLHVTCNQVILTASEGSTLDLFANPEFIPAFGGVSVISARVTEEIGTPVPDGTVVTFFTTLGRIPEQAKTNDGVARVNLIADSRSGTATVTAFSGADATDTTDVAIGGGIPPENILLTANPERLTDRRASTITATVTDADGNPVPNIAVVFTIDSVTPIGPARPIVIDEFMESRGSPVFTDNNGRATDVMRTNRPFDGLQVRVTVKGELLAGAKDDTVDVVVN